MKKLFLLITILTCWSCDDFILNDYWDYISSLEISASTRSITISIPKEEAYKGLKIRISELPTAEGGQEITLTEQKTVIKGLTPETIYYYYFLQGEQKGEIKSIQTKAYLPIYLSVKVENDSVKCIIRRSDYSYSDDDEGIHLNDSEIIEKGFCNEYESKKVNGEYRSWKKVIHGNSFAMSISESLHSVKAYVISEDDVVYSDIKFVREPIVNDIEKVYTADNIYLRCKIDGVWGTGWIYERFDFALSEDGNHWDSSRIPDSITYTDSGCIISTKLLTKGYYGASSWNFIKGKVRYFEGNRSNYESETTGNPYTINRSIATEKDAALFIRNSLDSFWYKYDEETKEGIANLETDLIIPNGWCTPLKIGGQLNGNGHTIDGFSFFPLFYLGYNRKICDLNIGTSSSVFNVCEGSSIHPSQTKAPQYFVCDYVYDSTFENCTVNGTIYAWNKDFQIAPPSTTGLNINANIIYK